MTAAGAELKATRRAGGPSPAPAIRLRGVSRSVLGRAKGIKLLLLDVDGILLDLPLMLRAGLAITVPDAAGEVRRAAQYVTRCPAGQGAVREAIELLLKAQGRWPKVLERYWR